MQRNPRHQRPAASARPSPSPPSHRLCHRLCKYVDFAHGCAARSLVVAFDPDGAIEGVVPATRRDSAEDATRRDGAEAATRQGGADAALSGIGDVSALISVLLTYGVSLDRIAEALPRDAAGAPSSEAPLAHALVAFLGRVEAAEGAVVRSRYIASEVARRSAVDGELAR